REELASRARRRRERIDGLAIELLRDDRQELVARAERLFLRHRLATPERHALHAAHVWRAWIGERRRDLLLACERAAAEHVARDRDERRFDEDLVGGIGLFLRVLRRLQDLASDDPAARPRR